MRFGISFVNYYSESYKCNLLSFVIWDKRIIRSDKAKLPVKISTTKIYDKSRIGGRYTNKRIKL
jgi:hypothetical protein